MTICPDPRRIVEFLPQVRPTWFFAVPRIWEKLKAGLEPAARASPRSSASRPWRGSTPRSRSFRLEQAGEDVPDELEAAVAQADEQLFSKLRTHSASTS